MQYSVSTPRKTFKKQTKTPKFQEVDTEIIFLPEAVGCLKTAPMLRSNLSVLHIHWSFDFSLLSV